MGTIRTTITIDEKLHKELTNLSKEQERSFSNQVVYLVKKGKEAEKATTVADNGRCICENDLTLGVDCFISKNKKWTCTYCGVIETIKDCGCNHMLYDCPYCGKHLT